MPTQWGFCKRMRLEYEEAAALMKVKNVPGLLVAIDTAKKQQQQQQLAVFKSKVIPPPALNCYATSLLSDTLKNMQKHTEAVQKYHSTPRFEAMIADITRSDAGSLIPGAKLALERKLTI
ncbi:hypothetical protein Trydic_g18803 [Trypoxylus dichotomus]